MVVEVEVLQYFDPVCVSTVVTWSTWRTDWSIWDLRFTSKDLSQASKGLYIQSLKRLVFSFVKTQLMKWDKPKSVLFMFSYPNIQKLYIWIIRQNP